jgi:transcriptional regulator with XRE-family HTH domain
MPRLDTEVLARRTEVARRYLQGEMQEELARAFGVSQQQISQDLQAIRRFWLSSAIRDFDAAKAEELAKIYAVEREYWMAWERSKKDKEIATQETDGIDQQTRKPKIKKATLRREGQSGNPAYLAGILACIDKRCQILGLDAPKRFVIKWDELTDEQIDRLAKGESPEKVLSA